MVVGLAIALLPLAVAMWWENWERRTVVGEDCTEIEDRTEMRKADPIRRAA